MFKRRLRKFMARQDTREAALELRKSHAALKDAEARLENEQRRVKNAHEAFSREVVSFNGRLAGAFAERVVTVQELNGRLRMVSFKREAVGPKKSWKEENDFQEHEALG